MSRNKVSRGSLTEQVERKLRHYILSGKIRPSTSLNIKDISKQLGTSVTPVREALMRLSAQGIIDAQPRKFRMPEISRERYIEISNLRLLLEGHAGELAATRISKRELSRVQSLADNYIKAVLAQEYTQAVEHNARFKLAVFAASGMSTLTSLIENLMLQVAPFFVASITPLPGADADWSRFSVRYTNEVVDGLVAKDPQRVRHALQGMILTGTQRVLADF